jgi:predicted hotdog family 3-hydroxylacyl-ACP dehydratase
LFKKLPMPNIDIESIIPHRKPIKVISEVIEVKEDSAITTAIVNPSWPLFEGDAVDSLVLIEAVAQTAAIVEGYKRKRQGKTGVKGWLVGIKNAEFKVLKIPVNTRLTIAVHSKSSFDNYGVVQGTIKRGEDVLATIVLQALRLNEDGE